jgi:hypothetical protein
MMVRSFAFCGGYASSLSGSQVTAKEGSNVSVKSKNDHHWPTAIRFHSEAGTHQAPLARVACDYRSLRVTEETQDQFEERSN